MAAEILCVARWIAGPKCSVGPVVDFVNNPRLETFRTDWPGNPREGGRFLGYRGQLDLGWRKVMRYMTSGNPQSAEKGADDYRPPEVTDDIHRPGDWVCWLGHASFLIQLDGVRYLTDPVWHNLGTLRRRVPAPYTPADIGRLDYVLLSHDHRDHCDARTLRELSGALDFTVLAPLGLHDVIRGYLRREQPVQEAGWYQRFDTPAEHPRVSLMPTQHWCRRYLTDTNRRLWGSFVLEGHERRLWFGGDSGYSPHFAEVAEYFPEVDLALVGIGAYKPAWFMQEAHTSPEQAFRGFADTRAKRLFPMHFGTYDLSQEPAGEPWRLLKAFAKTAGRAGDVVAPVVGRVVSV